MVWAAKVPIYYIVMLPNHLFVFIYYYNVFVSFFFLSPRWGRRGHELYSLLHIIREDIYDTRVYVVIMLLSRYQGY